MFRFERFHFIGIDGCRRMASSSSNCWNEVARFPGELSILALHRSRLDAWFAVAFPIKHKPRVMRAPKELPVGDFLRKTVITDEYYINGDRRIKRRKNTRADFVAWLKEFNDNYCEAPQQLLDGYLADLGDPYAKTTRL